MEERENTLGALGTLLERVEEYGKTTLELFKLKTVDKLSDAISSFASRIIAVVFFVMFFILASIGLSVWLGELLGKIWLGFLLVAGFYGLIGIVLFFMLHNPVKKQISNMIIKQILK
jgi:hypothetical protein